MLYQHILQIFLIASGSLLKEATAKCCSAGNCIDHADLPGRPGRFCTAKECPDGTKLASMFGCCGYGKCNIFCCNCDRRPSDGAICRTKSSRSLELLSEGADEDDAALFATVNTSGTGKMPLSEFLAFYEQTDRSAEDVNSDLVQKFNIYDQNGDGFLTVDEMRLGQSPKQRDEL